VLDADLDDGPLVRRRGAIPAEQRAADSSHGANGHTRCHGPRRGRWDRHTPSGRW
jgi:hypothetical protein